MAKVDPQTLKRMMVELGVTPYGDDALKEYAQELEGLVGVTSRLDSLDLTQEEPSHFFINWER